MAEQIEEMMQVGKKRKRKREIRKKEERIRKENEDEEEKKRKDEDRIFLNWNHLQIFFHNIKLDIHQ